MDVRVRVRRGADGDRPASDGPSPSPRVVPPGVEPEPAPIRIRGPLPPLPPLEGRPSALRSSRCNPPR